MFARRAAVSAVHWWPDSGRAGWEADGSQLSRWDVAARLSTDRQPLMRQWSLQSPAVRAVGYLSGHQWRASDRQCATSSVGVAATCRPSQKTPTRVRLTLKALCV